MCLKYPDILSDPKLYTQVESALILYNKEERVQILKSLIIYTTHLYKHHVLGFTEHVFMTIRGSIGKILTDNLEVQSCLIILLFECCKHEILLVKEIIETYFYIFDDLERVYSYQANTANSRKSEENSHGQSQSDTYNTNTMLYYRMLISLKDFVNDPDLPKTQQIWDLGDKVQQSLLKGLGSPNDEVRSLIFSEFETKNQEIESTTADRLVNIAMMLYNPEHEDLWLVNVVPLLLNLAKKSSDYTRLRFEETLGDLTAFYDWDFRKNMKLHNHSSQPYTPAFTLSTGALQRNALGTVQGSINPTIGGDKLRGMIRASQNSYLSQ